MEMTSVAPEEYLGGGGKFVPIDTQNSIFFSQFAIRTAFSWTILCLDTRQPGSVFKQLDTWQSEIIIEIPRYNSFNFS